MAAAGTVHVVDDDALMRASVRSLLVLSGYTVRIHEKATAFLAEAERAPGCVLTDIRMPEVDGLELQRRLRERNIMMPVIIMTGQGDITTAVEAMKAGAVDFLEKPFEPETLIAAVDRALARSAAIRESHAAFQTAQARLGSLTSREREVADLLFKGLSNKEIGLMLGTSPRTVEVHRARVMEKLHVQGVADLVRLMMSSNAA